MELEETQGAFQSPGLDVSSAAQNDGSCLVSACFCVPGGRRRAWMSGQVTVPSSCGCGEGAELKMCFRLRHAVTFRGRGLLHSCTAPMLAHVLESAPILIPNQACFVAVVFVFPHLCPKLFGGSTCLYKCAFIETVLLFSLYQKQQLSNIDQINYKNLSGNCSCSQIQIRLVPIKADLDTSLHSPEFLSAFSSAVESLRPLKLGVLSHLC